MALSSHDVPGHTVGLTGVAAVGADLEAGLADLLADSNGRAPRLFAARRLAVHVRYGTASGGALDVLLLSPGHVQLTVRRADGSPAATAGYDCLAYLRDEQIALQDHGVRWTFCIPGDRLCDLAVALAPRLARPSRGTAPIH